MDIQNLHSIALRLLTPGKGILAADESNNTCNARFESQGIPPTEENRRKYRQLLFTTPNIEKYVTGVILYDETLRQRTSPMTKIKGDKGMPFHDYLAQKGILCGIKVDEGLVEMPSFPGETITQGLDGLPARLQEYKSMGASFAKWRAAFKISGNTPTDEAIRENAKILARYAKACQDEGIVPIVEPEVILEGVHSIEKSRLVTEKVIKILFEEIPKYFVALEGLILKTSMVISGSQNENRADAKAVAKVTVEVLKNSVPAQLAGVIFLSGGQTPDEATENFREIAKLEPLPWPLAFSFSRALQNDALEIWEGKDENVRIAQKAFLERLQNNSLADQGL